MSLFPPEAGAPLNRVLEGRGRPARTSLTYRAPGRPAPAELPVRISPLAANAGYEVEVGGVGLTLDAPQRLEPVIVSKPWGREIWYTGHEARGESRVAGRGGSISLYAYLGLAPERLCGRDAVTLLKILEPGSEPVRDELYCEVHTSKTEVYVVTDVDRAAYPDGRGRMRLGVNQATRRRHGDDAAFRVAFLAAANAYEQARRAADAAGGSTTRKEAAARARVSEFMAEVSLEPGDVIEVPTGVPHGLPHGIRVIEFQTPAYERQIVYAAQRVLTQPAWDSAAAIAGLTLDAPPRRSPRQLSDAVEVVAETADFRLFRARLEPGAGWAPPACAYAVVLAARGRLRVGSRQGCVDLEAGAAAFIPGSAAEVALTCADGGELLLAVPGDSVPGAGRG